MGAAAAGGASIASTALSAYSSIAKGQGEQAADEYQATRAERAAQFGKVQAGLTDVTLREELNTTLSNIEVIRAAGKIDPTSPTTAAFEEHQKMLSDRQRLAAVGSIKQQVMQDEADAKYLREAGKFALNMGYLGAATKGVGALAKGFG